MNAAATKTRQANVSTIGPRESVGQLAAPIAQDHEDEGKTTLKELLDGRSVAYTPMAERQQIFLTIALVKQHLCVPTRKGHAPTDSDCVKYIMMCRQRGLNPWVADCYLLGYDTNSGP